MFEHVLAPVVSAALYGTSAYFITQSKSCPCTEVDETKRSYILGFSYAGIVYAFFGLVIGASPAFKLLFKYPILALVPVLFIIGQIAWAILTIQYTYTLKACKCNATAAENITFTHATLILVIAALMIPLAGFGIYAITRFK